MRDRVCVQKYTREKERDRRRVKKRTRVKARARKKARHEQNESNGERGRERSPKTPFEGDLAETTRGRRERERAVVERRNEKPFREHVRRCSRGGRPVVAGINTAFNVGRGRSWGPGGPQGASLSSSLPWPGRLARSTFISLSFLSSPGTPTPQPPPGPEGSLLFLRSAIRQIAIDTDDPLFLFFHFSSFTSLSLSLPLSQFAALLFVPPRARSSPLLNLRQRQKAVLSPWLAG